jgi:exosortase
MEKVPASRNSTKAKILPAALLLAALFLLGQSLPRLLTEWSGNENCEHVIFALPAALFVLFSYLRKPPGTGKTDWPTGASLLVFGLACLYMDAALEEIALLATGLIAGGYGAVFLLGGRERGKMLAFPFFLLLFVVPLPDLVARNLIHIHLQRASAATAGGMMGIFGYETSVSGTVLSVGANALNVAEQCSGLKFLTLLFFAALLIGHLLVPGRKYARIFLAAFSLPVALLANVLRLLMAGIIADSSGMLAADTFLHHGYAALLPYAGGIAALLLAATALRGFSLEPIAAEMVDKDRGNRI